MPTYSMVLLLSKMGNAALKEALKRSAEYIFEAGGTLRKIENLGFQKMPYFIRANGVKNTEAHYFIMDFDVSMEKNVQMMDKFKRDKEVVRATAFMMSKPIEKLLADKPKQECTLWQDLLPLTERPDVVKIMNVKSKKERSAEKHKFMYDGTGKNYSIL